jgi:hypothetical protein
MKCWRTSKEIGYHTGASATKVKSSNLHNEVKDFIEFFTNRNIDETPHTVIRERFLQLKTVFEKGNC